MAKKDKNFVKKAIDAIDKMLAEKGPQAMHNNTIIDLVPESAKGGKSCFIAIYNNAKNAQDPYQAWDHRFFIKVPGKYEKDGIAKPYFLSEGEQVDQPNHKLYVKLLELSGCKQEVINPETMAYHYSFGGDTLGYYNWSSFYGSYNTIKPFEGKIDFYNSEGFKLEGKLNDIELKFQGKLNDKGLKIQGKLNDNEFGFKFQHKSQDAMKKAGSGTGTAGEEQQKQSEVKQDVKISEKTASSHLSGTAGEASGSADSLNKPVVTQTAGSGAGEIYKHADGQHEPTFNGTMPEQADAHGQGSHEG